MDQGLFKQRVLGGERAWEHEDLGDAEKSGGPCVLEWGAEQAVLEARSCHQVDVPAEMPGPVGSRALGETAAAVR